MSKLPSSGILPKGWERLTRAEDGGIVYLNLSPQVVFRIEASVAGDATVIYFVGNIPVGVSEDLATVLSLLPSGR